VCKQAFQVLHHFYHRLCPACAAENYARRSDTADLTGYHALLTGGRIKIGFEIALMLLRAGATVLVTTRFANNAYQRFQAQPDFAEWQARLYVYGIDLRSLEAVQQLIADVQNFFPKLDILINNAAQTITRPLDYYLPLIQQEQQCLPQTKQILQLAQYTPPKTLAVFKQQAIALDEFNEPLDMRKQNSWRETLATVQTRELVETQVVNSIVPFMLCSQLKPLLMRSQNRRFIINVSAMEGQFNRVNKTHYHPHTNMAKAALNMLTRTAAMDYVRDGIYMNSVDTGWVTIEDPFAIRQKNRLNGMVSPLDCVDGAARVMTPIWEGIRGNLYYGQFLKDYKPTQW
jgi:NAD(P)-dependent dehydrogenase (short-subunit alcohol dehydrogenase family)